MVGIDLALDGEFHRLRIQRGTVVELDAGPELEGVLQPVLGDCPRLGQARHDLSALVGEGDQRLDDATPHTVRVEIGHLGRIEVDRLGDEAHHECPCRLSRGGHRPQTENQRDGDE